MEILLLLCVFVSLWVTGSTPGTEYSLFCPGQRKLYFHSNRFHVRRDRVVSTGCGIWPLTALPPCRSMTIRLQWLVEHSRVDLSPLAEALNHFSPQLCNLSPTSAHKTASLRCAVAHLHLLASCVLPPTARRFWIRHRTVVPLTNHSQECDTGSITRSVIASLILALANRIKKTVVNWSFNDGCNWRLFSSWISRLFFFFQQDD